MDNQYQQYRDGEPSSGSTSISHSSPHRSSSGSSKRNNRSEEHVEQLRSQLLETRKQLKVQELRTKEAKEETDQLFAHLKILNDKHLLAIQEAEKAKQELRLYKINLQHAQQEILHAQDILDDVDGQRYQAEREAAQARATVRRLNRDFLLRQAMEEGRRIGLREGFQRGQELAFQDHDSGGADEEVYDDVDDDSVQVRQRSLLITSAEDIRQRRSPPTIHNSVPPSDPVPVPPPEIQPVPNSRPRSFRSPSPSVYHGPVSIPPEGFIPALDADQFIRIPPPHELSRPPPTPERRASPALPPISQREEPILVTRPRSEHRRNSSLGSDSTSLSQMEMVNGPDYAGRRSPLSVIPEVHSAQSSPNPHSVAGQGLNHKLSWAGSRHSNGDPLGEASRSRAGSTRSFDPPETSRRSHSGVYENIAPASPKPPSVLLRPHSRASSMNHPQTYTPAGGASSANSARIALPVPPPIPGAYYTEAYGPSSPHTGAVHHYEQGDDDSISSGMSNDTLTTPVLGRHRN